MTTLLVNAPTDDKDAQRQALADAVNEYLNGSKAPRYRMSKRRKGLSMPPRNPQRVLRYADLIVTD